MERGMNINMKVRMKNPFFWIGLIGVAIAVIGVDVRTLTSWSAVVNTLSEFIRNPFAIGSAVIAILGVFIDPTTAGIGDSQLAMTYDRPKKDTESYGTGK